jgi:hypothetical protein
MNGGLVGMNSAKLAGEAIENIGFAIRARCRRAVGQGRRGGGARAEAGCGQPWRARKTCSTSCSSGSGLSLQGR